MSTDSLDKAVAAHLLYLEAAHKCDSATLRVFDRENPDATREQRELYLENERRSYLEWSKAVVEAAGGEDAILADLI